MSARFRFRLERVKRAREVEEEVARAVWARAETAAGVQESACALLRERIGQIRAELANAAGERIDPERILVAHHTLARALDSLRGRHERALTLRSQAELLREDWTETRRQVEALTRLEERRRNDFRIEEARQEAAEMDEAALRRSSSHGPLESDSRSDARAAEKGKPLPRDRRQAS